MRKHVLLAALVLLFVLQQACAVESSGHEGSASLTSEAAAEPSISVAAQASTSPDAQSADSEPVVSLGLPQIAETETIPDATPEAPSEAPGHTIKDNTSADTGNTEALPSPVKITVSDNNAQQELDMVMPEKGTVEQPPLMTRILKETSLSFDDITFSQLVLVAAEGSDAMIYCYDKGDNGLWKLSGDIGYIKGYVGKNGISYAKTEGDGCTPGGLFAFGYAFGNSAKPETGMEFRAVTAESYWVDDPNSKYYNQWAEDVTDADWRSAEHLSDNTRTYAYAVVVEYNMAPNTVSGKGSAIFLHCKDESTTGCIAAPREAILQILKWLSSDKNPGILIAAA